MTEKEYDEIIAPMLADVAKKCGELGGSIIARVEWDVGCAGVTRLGTDEKSGIAQRMTDYAALSRGNLDSMIMAMRRDGIDMSRTIFGRLHDQG